MARRLDQSPGNLEYEMFKAMVVYNNFAKHDEVLKLLQKHGEVERVLRWMVSRGKVPAKAAGALIEGFKKKLAEVRQGTRSMEQEVFKAVIVCNRIADYTTVRKLLEEAQSVESTILKLQFRDLITEPEAEAISTVYKQKLRDIKADEERRQQAAAARASASPVFDAEMVVERIASKMYGDVEIIRATGASLNEPDVVEEFRQQLFAVVERSSARRFVVSLAAVTLISERAIDVLTAAHTIALRKKAKLCMCDITPILRNQLRQLAPSRHPPAFANCVYAIHTF